MAKHSPSERVGPYQGECCAPVTLLEQNSPDKEMLSLRGCDNLESAPSSGDFYQNNIHRTVWGRKMFMFFRAYTVLLK